MDILANEWEVEDLKDWGVDINWDNVPYDDIVEQASEGSIKDFSEDTNYNSEKFIRQEISTDIVDKIKKGIDDGSIRPEIADILRRRAEQCTIFNFDEIIKFYRSKDASVLEKELLERLYLVFITPKEALEKGIIEIEKTTGEIYDKKLLEKNYE